MSNTPIEFKGSSFTLSVVHLHEVEPKAIHQVLRDKVAQAPALLKHAPIVIDVSGLESPVNWSMLQKAVVSTGLRITGVNECKDARFEAEIGEMGLPLLTEGKEKATRPASIEVPAPVVLPQNIIPITKTRLINVSVHPSQHIYVPQCDLTVTSYVSAGAELIADSSIHAYGVMRGHALTGASDDWETQISCTHLMAELVFIVDVYWLNDKTPAESYSKAARL